MKILKYQLLQGEINHGTEENPSIEPILIPHERCSDDENFERNYAIALKEAYNGEVTVEEVADPEVPADEPTVWDELDAAYQEGVDSV